MLTPAPCERERPAFRPAPAFRGRRVLFYLLAAALLMNLVIGPLPAGAGY
jgi:hypothetical protein